ncbi:MAG: DUF6335 family protein [Acidobacteriota bacterium]
MAHRRKFKTGDPVEPDRESLEDDRDSESIDQDVKDIFQEAQDLDYGRGDFVRMLESYTDRSPVLTGGDLDADWEDADVGEEAVGGQNPTPDQSVVDEEGEALGITYNDDEPLHTTDKLNQRDQNPWELNPASSPDFGERVKEEFHTPIKTLTAAAGLSDRPKPKTLKAPSRSGRTHQGQRGRPRKRTSSTATPRAKSNRPQNNRVTKVARGIKSPPTNVHRHASKGNQNKTKRA